jgi:hypothetical protein
MKELDLDKPCEHIDYTMAPMFGDDGAQLWKVQLFRAPFHETVIRYGNVQIDGGSSEIRFNFEVLETNDALTFNTDNEELQIFASEVLEDIIAIAVKDGWLGAKDVHDGNKPTTNDSSESVD